MTDQITEAAFQQKAEDAISQLESSFARLAEDRDLDVQVEGGVLSVSFEEDEPGRFIVSPNSSVRQLWVSARVSSFKFDCSDETGGFVLAGTGEPLKQVMTRLTREQLGDESIEL
jgi:iron donor protein CyaY